MLPTLSGADALAPVSRAVEWAAEASLIIFVCMYGNKRNFAYLS